MHLVDLTWHFYPVTIRNNMWHNIIYNNYTPYFVSSDKNTFQLITITIDKNTVNFLWTDNNY